MKNTTAAASLFLIVSSVSAFASDVEQPYEGFYGNVHGGLLVNFDSVDGERVTVPNLNLGAKLARDYSDSQWGWQADGDFAFIDSHWVRPKINGVKGNLSVIDTATHLTYRPNSTSKLGLYAGYGLINLNLKDAPDELELNMGVGGLGVEALTELGENTWVQGRVGLLDPFHASLMVTDGVTTEKESGTDILGDLLGGTVNGSLHQRFGDNVTARVEAGYTVLGVSGSSDISVMSLAVAGNYTFDQTPLSLGVEAGYLALSTDGETADAFNVGTTLTYSFGAASSGSTGKLFRSGILGFGL
jgi:hypothetical protein